MTSATIFADASMDHESKLAGWAAWMVGGGQGSHLHSGVFKTPVKDISEAEFLALGNALKIALAIGIVRRGSQVLLQSDSIWALCAMRTAVPTCADRPFAAGGLTAGRHKRVRYSAPILSAMTRIRDLVVTNDLELAVRHVRGHTRGDGRQWVNRACDKAAKAAMRGARATASATSADSEMTEAT